MTQLALPETWDEKMHRLALEFQALRIARDVTSCNTARWAKLTREVKDKAYEMDLHIAAVQ